MVSRAPLLRLKYPCGCFANHLLEHKVKWRATDFITSPTSFRYVRVKLMFNFLIHGEIHISQIKLSSNCFRGEPMSSYNNETSLLETLKCTIGCCTCGGRCSGGIPDQAGYVNFGKLHIFTCEVSSRADGRGSK